MQGNAAARAKLASIPYVCHAVHQAKTSPHELPSILAPHPSRSRVQVRTAGKSLRLLVRIAPACADMRFTNNLALINALYAKTQPTHIAAHLSASPAAASAKLVSTVFRDIGAYAKLSTARTLCRPGTRTSVASLSSSRTRERSCRLALGHKQHV